MCRACSIHEGKWILVGKPEVKRPLESSRRRREDNIRMDLRYIRWGCMDWIDLAQDMNQWRALVNTVVNLQVPQNVRKFLSRCATACFLKRAFRSMELFSRLVSFCIYRPKVYDR
jgi:hypothetical protein